jgi:nucleotide-binding universal stress UspA family protein
VPDYATSYLPVDFREKQLAEMRQALSMAAEGIENARIALVEGHSGRTILDHAKSAGTDCIVVASHRPGMQDLLLGSTATHLVRHAPCAVHVLR